MHQSNKKWGLEITWADTDKYSGRIIILNPHEQTHYSYHNKQDITIFVLQGKLNLTIEGNSKILAQGESYHIRPKIMYRMAAFQDTTTILEAGTKIVDDVIVVEQ